MPTSYTNAVQDGTISSLRAFAWRCARAVCASMRDEPLDHVICDLTPDTEYHDEQVTKATNRLAQLAIMTPADCDMAAEHDFQTALQSRQERQAMQALQRTRYEHVLHQVTAWDVPAALTHLRAFMISQLVNSIEYDCKFDDDAPNPQTGVEWHARKQKSALWHIDYHTKERVKIIASVNDHNLWLNTLRVSLIDQPATSMDPQIWKRHFIAEFSRRLRDAGLQDDEADLFAIAVQHADASWPDYQHDDPKDVAEGEFDALADSV